MKNQKRALTLGLCLLLAVGSMAGCTKEKAAAEPEKTETTGVKTETSGDTEGTEGSGAAPSDLSGTLKMYGPGLFAAVGENGTVDMVTGMERPGYKTLVDRWAELYPNVKLDIEPIPWDNWKAAIQTAALSGEYDILIHGNGNADYSLDLTEFLEADQEVTDVLSFYPYRRNPDNMKEIRPYGLSYTLNPVVCVINKSILSNYGVAIPDASWTLEDMAEIAKTCTGTDPVSGKQTYGISMVKASDAFKNYILIGRAFNNQIFEFQEKLVDTKVSFANETTNKAFDYLETMGQYSSPDYLEGLDLANAYTPEHNLAMIWAEDVYNIYNRIKAAGLEDQYMFLQLPAIQEGVHKGITSSNVGDLNICIYKDSKQKELAWEFLKFLVTDPVIQQWYIATNSIPANVEMGSLLYDVMPAEYADAITETINTSPEGFNSSASAWYDSTWFGTFQSDIVTEFDELLKGNKTSQEVTESIQKNIDGYLNAMK